MADNHLRYGYAGTGLGQVRNLEEVSPERFIHYTAHPATVPLLVSLAYRLSGDNGPAATRFFPLLAALLGFALLWLLGRRLLGATVASWALCLWALSGMVLGHGVNASYEPFVLCSLLGTMLAHAQGRHGWTAVSLFVGGLFDFPALYPAPFLALHLWVRGGRTWTSAARAAGVLLACAASVSVHLLHVASLGAGALTGRGPGRIGLLEYALDVLTLRQFAAAASVGGPEDAGAWLAAQAGFLVWGFSVPGLLLAAAGVAVLGRRMPFPLAVLGICAAIHVVLLPIHSSVHDFWWIYLTPFVALCGGSALAQVQRRAAGFGRSAAALAPIALLLACAVPGWQAGLALWRLRADPRPRVWGHQLRRIASSDEIVFLMARDLLGWPLARYRGHPVLESTFLLEEDFVRAAAHLRAEGHLVRPIKLFVPRPLHDSDEARGYLAERFAGRFEGLRGAVTPAGETGFAVYDIGPLLR